MRQTKAHPLTLNLRMLAYKPYVLPLAYRALKLGALVILQSDDDRVFLGASELRCISSGSLRIGRRNVLPAHCTTMILPVVQLTSTVSGETP